jgi:hypothetical protein
MGVTVSSARGGWHFTTSDWEMLVELACMYGWEAIAESDYPGGKVTADGARKLADALERALPDIPRHDALRHKARETPFGLGFDPDVPLSPLEFFSGPGGRRHLREFVAFCRGGEFWLA